MVNNIEFNEQKNSSEISPTSNINNFEGKLISFIISIFGGLVKNEKQARQIVFVVVLVFLLISLYYFMQSFGSSNGKEVLKSISA